MRNYKIAIFLLSLIFIFNSHLHAQQLDKPSTFLEGYCGSDVLSKAFQNLDISSSKIDSATKKLNALADGNRGFNSFYEIKQIAKEFGLHIRACEVDLNVLRRLTKDSQVIVNITENNHFCLIKAVTEKGVLVYDPGLNYKNFEIPFYLFEKVWDGKLLAISKKGKSFKLAEGIKRELKDEELKEILGGQPCGNVSSSFFGSIADFSGGIFRWIFGNGPSHEDTPSSSSPAQSSTTDPVVIWNGNLALQVKDMSIPTRSLPLYLTRYYNAQVISEVPGWHPDPGSGSWVIENGKYSGEGDRTTTDNKFQDFTLEIDMKTISSSTSNTWDVARIYFRYIEKPQSWRDIKDSYYFLIHKDKKIELTKIVNGTQYSLTNKYTNYDPLTKHRIKIQVSGSNIKIYIDGVLEINYTDPSPLVAAGRIALEASFAHAHFDNAIITSGSSTYNYNFDTDDTRFIFGYGWTHSYGLRINQYADHITLVRENGSKEICYEYEPNKYKHVAYNMYNDLTKDSTGFTLRTKHGVVYRFDLAGKLLYIEDRNQNRTSLTYNIVNGREVPIEIIEPAGRKITLTYGTNNMVSKATDSQGNYLQYYYDSSNHLTKVIDRRGHDANYAYDPVTHNMTQLIDKEGNAYSYTYTYADRVNTQTDPSGNTTTFDYLWSTTHVINKKGEIYKYNFDNRLFLQSITDPNNIMERTTNDENGNITNYYDKKNNHTNFTYDAQGNRTGIYDAKGKWTSFTYHPTFSLPTSLTDARGSITTFDYDAKGNLIKSVDAENNVTTYVPNSYGQTESMTDPEGNITRFTYDVYGNPDMVMNTRGDVTNYDYDILGKLKRVVDPLDYITEYTYDENGNPASIEDPLGNITTYTYTNNDKLKSLVDPLGNTTNYTYDCFGNLLTVTDSLGKVTRYTYDTTNQMHLNRSNLKTITDANSNVTAYEYNPLDRLTKITDAKGRFYLFEYDAQGNPKARTDANSNLTFYYYDVLNWLYRIEYSDGTFVEYALDNVGNITQMQDQTGINSYLYDKLNRLKIQSYPDGTTLVHTYDLNGNRTDLNISIFGKILYDYDSLNRLNTITYPDGKTARFDYDKNSRRTFLQYPNSSTATYSYYDNGLIRELTNINSSSQPISRFTYNYDAASRRRGLGLLNGTLTYDYDKLNQLTSESGTIDSQAFSLAYAYDSVGNRLTMNDNGQVTNYIPNNLNQLTLNSNAAQKLIQVRGTVQDASPVTVTVNNIPATVSSGQFTASNILLNAGSNSIKAVATDTSNNIGSHQISVTYLPPAAVTYAYDNNGNLIQRVIGSVTEAFAYDLENRLKSYSSPANSAAYTYNGLGKRMSKIVNGLTTQYYYDGNEVILEKTDSSSIYYIHSNRLDEIISDSRGYSYHYDGLGSVVNLTDSNGVKAASYTYQSFGSIRSQTGTVSNSWLFTGRQFDNESGLYNYRNRYYSPSIGRFTTQDPSLTFNPHTRIIPYRLFNQLNNPLELHKYLYCINNPTNLIDPFGLEGGSDTGQTGWWPEWAEPFVPGYGNYGGPMRTDPTFSTPPIDSMDALFMQHDIAWSQGQGREADVILLRNLYNLPVDPRNWNEPASNPSGARIYRELAKDYFWWSNRREE